jgi:hypothetical protein
MSRGRGSSYPRQPTKAPPNPTRSGVSKKRTGTSEGHHRLENWVQVPARIVSAIKSGRPSLAKSSGDSEEDLRPQGRDMEGRYNIRETFAMVSAVERLDHHRDQV